MLSFHYGDDYEDVQVGIDEAGRGCFAGPVVAGAVIWDRCWLLENADVYPELGKIKDSKKVSKKEREKLFHFIKEHATDYCVSFVDNDTIDDINILNATYKAMHTALDGLHCEFSRILVDGNSFKTYFSKNKNVFVTPHYCITGGDNQYLNIASASILAKVSRDQYMERLCIDDPQYSERYDWDNNKGYGTAKHIKGIHAFGITSLHRKTFGICKGYA